MNDPATNNKKLPKRRSSSINIDRKQKQKRLDFSLSTNISSSQTSAPRQNGSMPAKTPERRSKTIPETLPSTYILHYY